MQLQSILLPSAEICKEDCLYFHRNRHTVNFDGYFNLFYIEKRKYYTNLETLSLHLIASGYRCIHLMHDREEIESYPLNSAVSSEYCFAYPYQETSGGVFWFSLEEDPDQEERKISGFFEGTAKNLHPVNLAVDICTFRREKYVLRNLETIDRFVHRKEENSCAEDSGLAPEASGHIQVFLVDNGRTLEQNPSSAEWIEKNRDMIHLIPNRNVGGAGGFTRGMLEALKEQKKYQLTHVLLMDDDAVFDPDVFVRIYGFLATVREQYRDITLGGTLLREDYPTIMQAGGEWFRNFLVRNDHPLYDLSTVKNCTAAFLENPVPEHSMTFSAWWCCCYSMDRGDGKSGTVRYDNLPLPLFLHHDDITYGLRNRENGIVFLNGVSVWHKGFGLTFARVNEYYDIRNPLITETLFHPDVSSLSIILKIWTAMTVMLVKYRYAEAYLVYRGLVDFLKGPDWLCRIDPEKLNDKLRAFVNRHFPMVRWEELGDEWSEQKKEIQTTIENFDFEDVRRSSFSRKLSFRKIVYLATLNGWLLPSDEKTAAVASTDSWSRAFRKKKIVLYEPTTGMASVAVRDSRKMAMFLGLYLESAVLILRHYHRIADRYRKEAGKISSYRMWSRYLGIDKK